MNQHLLVKIYQLGVAYLANSLTKAGPMSEANALGLTSDRHLDLAHITGAAE